MSKSRNIAAATLGVGEFEIPAPTLEHKGEPGMHLYSGCTLGSHRFRIYIPTTIYDGNNAQIRVYESETAESELPSKPEKVVAARDVPMSSFAWWDAPLQTLVMGEEDETNIIDTAKNLERELRTRK
jgi:hypothetical protein